jgi:lipid-binding SYLF domain-containing protein
MLDAELKRSFTMSSRVFALAVTFGLLLPVFAASSLQDDVGRIQQSDKIFQEVMNTPDKGIPQEILEGAECIAIVPSQKNFAFVFGGTYGKGVAVCRHNARWGAPMFIQVGGGSWGLQIGGQSTDIIMVFRTQAGLESLLSDKVRLGAGANAAAGPVGRHVSAATDVSMHSEILTYSRSRGAFAGISLNGDIVQPDKTGNSAMYGSSKWRNILSGNVRSPKSTRHFLATLDHYSATADGRS